MSTCKDAIDQLVDYLHSEVEEPDEEKLLEHLDLCQMCCSHYEFQQRLTAVIVDRAQGETCPEVLKQTILDKIKMMNELDVELENVLGM